MDLADELSCLLGRRGWRSPPNCQPWQRDWLNQSGEEPLGVAMPASTAEVTQILKLCHQAQVPVVPQGGNTSLAGGSVLGESGGVIVSLSRMNRISSPDVESGTIEVEAGAVLANIHSGLEGSGFMLPMRLGSEGSAQVGGLISTNAGGSHAFRYGMMQDLVLGLEVVLADGQIWNGMRNVQKDNAGYQLRKLFCGSEGTLGVISKATLKLHPEPVQHVTACLSLSDFNSASRLATSLRREAGDFLTAVEFFSDFGLEMALAHIPSLRFPFSERAPHYLLIEVSSSSAKVPLEDILNDVIERAFDANLILDGVIATSLSKRAELWRLREEQPEGQRLAGPQLKHDISVSPGRLAVFLLEAEKICMSILPGVRINPFGHIADGNVHYNLSPPLGQQSFAGQEAEFASQLGELASEMGGSFAAEHGLGRTKVWLADRLRNPVERRLMANLKSAIDSTRNLNPGTLTASLKLVRPVI